MTAVSLGEDGTMTIKLTDDFEGGTTFIVSVLAFVLKEELGQEQGRALSEKIVARAGKEMEKFVGVEVAEEVVK